MEFNLYENLDISKDSFYFLLRKDLLDIYYSTLNFLK